MKFSVLIVGLGQIGMGYDLSLDAASHVLTHARAFHQHARFELTSAVDSDSKRCRLFGERYKLPAYTTLAEAFENVQPDVVVIATPTPAHGPTLHAILEMSNPRAILCEKPLSYDIDEAREMLSACAAKGCELYVNYMRCSDPGAMEVKRRIEDGRIMSPVKGVAWYSKGMLHNGSHFFNLLESWLGNSVDFKVIQPGRMWEGHDPEPDLHVTFERGNICFIAAQEENYSHYTIELVTPNGRLRYEQGGARILWQAAVDDPVYAGYTVLAAREEMIETGMSQSQWHVTDQLAACLDRRAGQICSGYTAMKTLKLLAAIRSTL